MCFCRNKNLKDFLWTKAKVNNKAQKVILSSRKGCSIPCHSKTGNLCYKQLKHTNTFSSTVTKRIYNIYNKLNYKSSCLIYLKECKLCKRQYTGKSETTFKIRLNNHRKDVYKTNTPEADQHFRLPGYNFNRHTKCTLIEQLNNIELDKELLTFRLKKREDFWIHKLKLSSHMDSMLNLSSLTPKISAFLVQYFLEGLMQKGLL